MRTNKLYKEVVIVVLLWMAPSILFAQIKLEGNTNRINTHFKYSYTKNDETAKNDYTKAIAENDNAKEKYDKAKMKYDNDSINAVRIQDSAVHVAERQVEKTDAAKRAANTHYIKIKAESDSAKVKYSIAKKKYEEIKDNHTESMRATIVKDSIAMQLAKMKVEETDSLKEVAENEKTKAKTENDTANEIYDKAKMKFERVKNNHDASMSPERIQDSIAMQVAKLEAEKTDSVKNAAQKSMKKKVLSLRSVDSVIVIATINDTIFKFSIIDINTRRYPKKTFGNPYSESRDLSNIRFECEYLVGYTASVDNTNLKLIPAATSNNNAVYSIDISNILPKQHGIVSTIIDKLPTDTKTFPIVWPKSYTTTTSANTSIKKKLDFNKLYHFAVFEKHQEFWYFGFNYTPSIAFRTTRINEAQFTHVNEQEIRINNERSAYGYGLDARLGCSFHSKASGYKNIHTLYGSFIANKQGFIADSVGAIDWKQGIDTGALGKQQYSFEHYGFGIGYNYTQYKHLFNFCFDAQLNYLWLSKYTINQASPSTGADKFREMGLRRHAFGFKTAAGISCRPNYWIDIHLMPTFNYNISSANKATILRSNLYSFGLMTGVSFRLMKNEYHN